MGTFGALAAARSTQKTLLHARARKKSSDPTARYSRYSNSNTAQVEESSFDDHKLYLASRSKRAKPATSSRTKPGTLLLLLPKLAALSSSKHLGKLVKLLYVMPFLCGSRKPEQISIPDQNSADLTKN
jgi:hypothetical protein